ncbi:MAG: tannase/feruloyl esterase family alpha/beta hydrolase [Terracidiphilus sp.]
MRILSVLSVSASLLLSSHSVIAASAGETQVQSAAPVSSESCERLASLELPNASITMAKAVAAGTFVGPPEEFTGRDLSAFYKLLPAFCRVVVHARPSADSDIVVELWMPLSGWSGKLEGLGNGGFAGQIAYEGLGGAMFHGSAAVATDTGHSGSPIDAAWAMGHPAKIADFGHRGIHEMTRVGKLVVEKFYGSGAKRSYFIGCSDGGREALMEAQRYPADYDGILAGAPANYWTGLLSTAVVDLQALTATPESFIPPAKISVIANAVLAACDKLDGAADGILNDPRQCHFDPASIECKAGEATDKCLTAPQVASLKAIYAGLRDASGKQIFPGYLPGAEEGRGGWETWITGPAPAKSAQAFFGIGYFSNMVYEKRGWDYKSFAVDSGIQTAKDKTAGALDAVNADLTPFQARGGKLILYHGWNDPAIPALNTVNYYSEVLAKMGQTNADSFVRLYMIPGMQHCGGGTGPDDFGQFGVSGHNDPQHNAFVALENWVEKGTAPGSFIASKHAGGAPTGAVTMTRPLCPYPQTAEYKGSGDPNSAESFVCSAKK